MITTQEYNEMRDPGLKYEISYLTPDTAPQSRLGLWNKYLVCLDPTMAKTMLGSRYGIISTPNGRTATGVIRLRNKDLDLPLIRVDDEVFFTATKPVRGTDCAGVYLHEDGSYAVYSPLGDMYHLSGTPSPGSDFSLNNYTPVEQGTTFTIIVTA